MKALRIGELARAVGLNPKTLRYYEEIGLLPVPARTASGYRQYGPAERERLAFVLKARAIGLTLEEIGEILSLRRQGQQPCEHVVALLDRKVAAIDAQLRALADVRAELLELRAEAEASVRRAAPVCAIIEHHQRRDASPGEPRLSTSGPRRAPSRAD